ncbi:hypothetical protein [Paraliobacillus ryukyuensis]|uniref:hypothetical protein n=1 Tax=Paraliobacillus ryukyuensis TaxID=200904 RepID=UPI00117D31AA|nr:hypothetical protein [Paraliobacillus ryukyuensis]
MMSVDLRKMLKENQNKLLSLTSGICLLSAGFIVGLINKNLEWFHFVPLILMYIGGFCAAKYMR